MRNAKHMPGPWRLMACNESVSIVYAGSIEVARCITVVDGVDDGAGRKYERIKEANTRLIASAPELLDALIDADEMFAIEGFHECGHTRGKIRAAIAKATGGCQ